MAEAYAVTDIRHPDHHTLLLPFITLTTRLLREIQLECRPDQPSPPARLPGHVHATVSRALGITLDCVSELWDCAGNLIWNSERRTRETQEVEAASCRQMLNHELDEDVIHHDNRLGE